MEMKQFNGYSQMKNEIWRQQMRFLLYFFPERSGPFYRKAEQACSVFFTGLLLALILAPCAQAQGITGSIAGTVSDSSGAIILGATVTVRNLNTNAVRQVATSGIGSYEITLLPPGNYSVKVDKAGFKAFEQDNITLQIDQVAQINAQLQVGSEQTTVTVTTAPPLLQTEESSIGQVIDSMALQNTPLNGRLSLLTLMLLAPGVQNLATAQDSIPAFGVTLSVGTGRRNSYGGMTTTLDGTVNEEVSLQRSEAEIPSIDALEEFKFITSGAPAEFGQPSEIIVASKGGGNKYHGEVLEFNRSKGMNAKLYSFVPAASTGPRAPYERNEFGGNFSGPLTIPRFYNGADRSFFFSAYEGFRYTYSAAANTAEPTALERQGNFTEFLAGGACNPSGSSIFVSNPLTGNTYGGTNVISSTDINPVSLQLLNLLYPAPTTTGCNTTNTYQTVDYTQAATRFSTRLDHKLTDKDQLRATFLHAFYGPYAFGYVSSLQGGYSAEGEHNVNTILGWTHTISPTTVLDTTASFLHLVIVRQPHDYNIDFSSIIPGLGTAQAAGAPHISMSDGSLVTTGDSGGGHPGLEQDIQYNTSLTRIFPRHTLKAGFGYLWSDFFNDTIVNSGTFGFGSGSGGYSGVPFADFMLGIPNTSANGNPPHFSYRIFESQYSAYAQDDWKIAPKLTLNLGLRYDLQWFSDDQQGRNALYIPEQQQLVIFGNSIPSSAVSGYVNPLEADGRIETSANANMSSNPWSYLGQTTKNFAPRAGFAYQAHPRTVIRGAYGIYYNLIPSQYVNTEIANTPFTASVNYSNGSAANASSFTMSNPFSATGAYSKNFGVGAQAKVKTPYTESYNLAVEQEFPDGFDLRIGYVGQHNIKQNNASGPGNTTPNLNLTPYPLTNISGKAQSYYLIQPFSSITLNTVPYFHSMLNSLQVGLHKQLAHNLAVNAEYQWVRILGVENIQNPSGIDLHDSYGPASGATPQVLNLNYTYKLPIGRGQLLLGNAPRLLDTILGGWQWSGMGTFQSGQPFSVTANTPSHTVGVSSVRANLVPGVALYPAHKTNAEWFNPAAFVAPGSYTGSDGNTYAAMGNSGYDMLRGPGYWSTDMNLEKNIRWADHYNVQVRADAFNLFNHPNFATPAANISSTTSVGIISATSSTPSAESRSVEFGAKFNF
jgi:hypothetical protein